MPEPRSVSLLRPLAVFSGIAFAIFLVGALMGYIRGVSGDDGSHDQAMMWAMKTGLLLIAMSGALGLLGALVSARFKLPPTIGWAIMMGIAFAIMNGGGVLLGIGEGDFLTEVGSGFFSGAIVGAISGLFIARNQRKLAANNSCPDDSPTQELG